MSLVLTLNILTEHDALIIVVNGLGTTLYNMYVCLLCVIACVVNVLTHPDSVILSFTGKLM